MKIRDICSQTLHIYKPTGKAFASFPDITDYLLDYSDNHISLGEICLEDVHILKMLWEDSREKQKVTGETLKDKFPILLTLETGESSFIKVRCVVNSIDYTNRQALVEYVSKGVCIY